MDDIIVTIILRGLLLLIFFPVLLVFYWKILEVCFSHPWPQLFKVKLARFLTQRGLHIVSLMFGLLIGIFGYLTYLSYDKLIFSNYDDTAEIINVVSNLVKGQAFYCDHIQNIQGISRDKSASCFALGIHFIPYWVLQALFFWLWPNVINLALQQVVLVSVGIFAMYALAGEQTKNKLLALIFAGVYATAFFVHQLELADIDTEILGLPFLLFTFYFLEKRKPAAFVIFLLISLSLREDICFMVMGIGVMSYIQRREKFYIYTPLILGALYGVVVLGILMPYYSGGIFLPHLKRFGFQGFHIENKIAALELFRIFTTVMFLRVLLPLFVITLIFAPSYFIPALPFIARNFLMNVSIITWYPKYWTVIFTCLLAGLAPACLRWAEKDPLSPRVKTFSPQSRVTFLALFILLSNFNTHYLIAPEILGINIDKYQKPSINRYFAFEPVIWINRVIYSPRFTAPSLGDEVKTISRQLPDDALILYNDLRLKIPLATKKNLRFAFLPHHYSQIVPGKTFWILPTELAFLGDYMVSKGYRLIYLGKAYLLYYH